MNIISKIEKKFGRYSIRNLTLYLIIGYGIGYLLFMFQPKILFMLTLDPAAVMHGQVWRLFTWIITPPVFGVDIFTIIMLIFYYSLGSLLERTIGTFLYNLYMFSSMLFTMIGIMLAHIFCTYIIRYDYASSTGYFAYASTYYILMSIFLAIAVCYPDMSVLYAMIIPIKMKYLALADAALYLYYFIVGGASTRVTIVLCLLNVFLFLGGDIINTIRRESRYWKTRYNFRKAMRK